MFHIKKTFSIGIYSILLLLLVTPVNAEKQSIEEQVKEAQAGETIKLQPGEYEENIVIDKPVHLIGEEGVTLIQKDSSPVLTIMSNQVKIENVNMKQTDKQGESPAVLIHGDDNSLHNITIETNGGGIQLEEANNNILSEITITGNEAIILKERAHGIDLWESHQNEIHDTTIKHVQDGIYMENSEGVQLNGNTVSHSRYGYHLMFTEDTVVENNHAYENVSGLYIMGANAPLVKDNVLKDNQKNVQSLGLFVFNTEDALITGNEIVNNRIGIKVEHVSDNEFTNNQVQGNFIGLQLNRAMDNEITHHSFTANVVQGQAIESSGNYTNGNYWSDHVGLDFTGDEKSDLTYKVDPFFLSVVSDYPVFQLLFQAPGMIFLKELIHTPADEQLTDETPLITNPFPVPNDSGDRSWSLFFVCILFVIFSLSIIYLGVRGNETN